MIRFISALLAAGIFVGCGNESEKLEKQISALKERVSMLETERNQYKTYSERVGGDAKKLKFLASKMSR